MLARVMLQNTFQAEIDRASSSEWAAMLDLFHDANLYQTWSYGAVRWGAVNLSHLVVKKNGKVMAIAQLRIVRSAIPKLGIAYLRWGPLWERRGEQSILDTAAYTAQILEQEYVRKRGLLLRVLPNAFDGSGRAAIFRSAFKEFKVELSTGNSIYRTSIL